MRLDRYSALTFAGIHPEDLAPDLAAWVLPEPGPARNRRQAIGVRADWQAADLLDAGDWIGTEGCSIRVRWSADRAEYLLRFVHRDETPEIFWYTMFRLTRQQEGTLLEAAVARDAPRGVFLEPKAAAPRVVMWLLEKHDALVRPRELVLPPLNARTEQEVAAIVNQLLVAPERTVPVVIVARDVNGNGAAVKLDVIARRMQGIAVVASLDGSGATSAFERMLTELGLSPDLRCFNGGVHTYGKASAIEADHRLWTRRSLEMLPDNIRSEHAGEALARHLSLDRAPPSFLFAIDDFDRRQRSAKQAQSLSGSDAGAVLDVNKLRADLGAAEALLAELQERSMKMEEDWRAAERQREIAELDASNEKVLREALQERFGELRRADTAASLNVELREGLRNLLTKAPTPAQSLQIIQAIFPDRVVVLQEALDSAETDGARYRKPEEVWDLLKRLCTGYYEALVVGGGDAVARRVFTGSEYAAQGSDGEMNSPACIRDRARVYKGVEHIMWPHLRVGGKGAAEDCLRIHFKWIADERKIVIGHCGAHLKEA